MVKNSVGGNQGKKVARKHAFVSNKTTVVSKSDDELYGIVVKVLGGNQFEVKCNDSINRLCILRKKFTGKNKFNNFIKVGGWVLIGLRQWETSKPGKMDKCDLIECYNDNDKSYLQTNFNVEVLLNEEKNIEGINIENDDNIVFEDADAHLDEDMIDIEDI